MKTFLYTIFLLLFIGVIGIAVYAFVQFGGVQHFVYLFGREDRPVSTEDVAFISNEGVISGTYTIDTKASTVTWSGSRPSVRDIAHRGTIGIEGGEIIVAGEESVGTVTLSMQDVEILNENEADTAALKSLLSGRYFFDSEQFPTAKFNIIKVEQNSENNNTVTIFATLELRGETRELNFPATIYMKGDNLRVAADLNLSRLEWGMTYNSASVLGKLAEKAIEDTVGVSLDITAVLSY